MSDAVLFDARDDGIAVITLNRPDQRNALGKDVRDGLFAAWDRFERDPALRVAILTGAGDKAFCAGGDLKEMVEHELQVPPRCSLSRKSKWAAVRPGPHRLSI